MVFLFSEGICIIISGTVDNWKLKFSKQTHLTHNVDVCMWKMRI